MKFGGIGKPSAESLQLVTIIPQIQNWGKSGKLTQQLCSSSFHPTQKQVSEMYSFKKNYWQLSRLGPFHIRSHCDPPRSHYLLVFFSENNDMPVRRYVRAPVLHTCLVPCLPTMPTQQCHYQTFINLTNCGYIDNNLFLPKSSKII